MPFPVAETIPGAFRLLIQSLAAKSSEGLQRFTFLTGVSKFSKVSVFSDLNNLKGRTMSLKEATLLVYTYEEVKRSFLEDLVGAYVELEKIDANNLQRMAGEALLAKIAGRERYGAG